jgi:hypothetical protein
VHDRGDNVGGCAFRVESIELGAWNWRNMGKGNSSGDGDEVLNIRYKIQIFGTIYIIFTVSVPIRYTIHYAIYTIPMQYTLYLCNIHYTYAIYTIHYAIYTIPMQYTL